MSDPRRDELHDLAHALRTPIAIIQGFADLLLRDEGTLSEDQRREYAERIRSAAGDLRAELDQRISLVDRS
jgi:signal transduction histidine kinase